MVIHDAATFAGLVVTCRVIGILQIEQKNKGNAERNDRLFAVPRRSIPSKLLKDVREHLEGRFRMSLRSFLSPQTSLRTRSSRCLGWKGPKVALQAIKDGAKSFAEERQITPRAPLALIVFFITRPAWAALPEPAFRIVPLSFSSRPRKHARTAASSGLRLPTAPTQLALGLRFQPKHEIAVHIGAQHFRMNIAFAAYGRRIAEPACHFFDSCAEIALGLGGAVEALKLVERHRGEDRSRPGAEILCGDILTGDFPEITFTLVDATS